MRARSKRPRRPWLLYLDGGRTVTVKAARTAGHAAAIARRYLASVGEKQHPAMFRHLVAVVPARIAAP